MTNLSEHNLDWARRMILDYRDLAYGRDLSTTPKQRRLVANDARQWLAGESWDQHNINEKFKQHCA